MAKVRSSRQTLGVRRATVGAAQEQSGEDLWCGTASENNAIL